MKCYTVFPTFDGNIRRIKKQGSTEMDTLRAPFFWAAVVVLALTILVELASVAIMPGAPSGLNASTPGWAIRYLAIVDLLLAYGLATQAFGLLLPRAMVGRLQGIVALVLSFLGCLGAIAMAILGAGRADPDGDAARRDPVRDDRVHGGLGNLSGRNGRGDARARHVPQACVLRAPAAGRAALPPEQGPGRALRAVDRADLAGGRS